MEVAISWTGIELGHFYALLCVSQTFASSVPPCLGMFTSLLSLRGLEQWSPIPTTLDGIKAIEGDTLRSAEFQLQQPYILITWLRNHPLCFSSVSNQL